MSVVRGAATGASAGGRRRRPNRMPNRIRRSVLWVPPTAPARAPNEAPERRPSPHCPQSRTAPLGVLHQANRRSRRTHVRSPSAERPVRRSGLITCIGKWCGTDPRTIVPCRPERISAQCHLLRRASNRWTARRGIASSLPVPVGARQVLVIDATPPWKAVDGVSATRLCCWGAVLGVYAGGAGSQTVLLSCDVPVGGYVTGHSSRERPQALRALNVQTLSSHILRWRYQEK
jgi:hypothetical protein